LGKEMNRSALKILRAVAKHGELPVDDVVRIGSRVYGDHRDQYPLAMLIEEEYLGLTITQIPKDGAEGMREFSLAITLHMDSLPKAADGSVEYHGVRMTSSIDPNWRRVFLKARGSLYLTEREEKRTERLFVILVAVISACLATWFSPK